MGLFDKLKKSKEHENVTQFAVTEEQRKRDEERNQRRKETDALTTWLNIGKDKWRGEDDERTDLYGASIFFDDQGGEKPDICVSCNRKLIFKVTSRMNAYDNISKLVGKKADHLIAEKREKDGRFYYRIGLVFWPPKA